jgi:Flp pilus assembly protein TadG
MLNAIRRLIRHLRHENRGNVAIVSALCLPIIIGAFGLGAEAASWMSTKRALQNAADAAAIAAATNGGSTYDTEAFATVGNYGFTNGQNGVAVYASNTEPCPAGAGPICYSVTVTQTVPVLLAQVVGFRGDTTNPNNPQKIIRAKAIAQQGTTQRPYCLLALAHSGKDPAITTDGAPFANFSGCNVMSNTGATCNGHNLQADVGDAHGVNNGCGVVQHSNMKAVADSYADMAKNIPPNPCPGKYPSPNTYPQETGKKNKITWTPAARPGENLIDDTTVWNAGGYTTICGDAQLQKDVTIPVDTTLVIYNGQLDTNGNTLASAAGKGVTVIFSGDNGSYIHAPTGGGTLDLAAPTGADSPWRGMVMYQDPKLTTGVDMSAAGNSPTWDLSGMAYFPYASVQFSGAVNKSSNGKSCFAMLVDNITVNGTGSILSHDQCGEAGVTLPTNDVPGRGKLVQ